VGILHPEGNWFSQRVCRCVFAAQLFWVEGAPQGAITYRTNFVPPAGLSTPPEVKSAENRVQEVERRIEARKIERALEDLNKDLDEANLAFGPIDGLRLKRIRLEAGEGETGLISKYNQQRRHVRLEVENLSDEDWAVRVLDGVPYSEQDDLQVSVTSTPKPDEVAAGETETFDIKTELTWPDDKVFQ